MNQDNLDRRESNSKSIPENQDSRLRACFLQGLAWTLFVGVATFAFLSLLPNCYRSTSIVTPAADDYKQSPTVGALASLGFLTGVPSKVESVETLFRSNDLTVRVFKKYPFLKHLLGDGFDERKNYYRPGIMSMILGPIRSSKTTTEWDAIRLAKKNMTVSVSKRSETITISFDSLSPEASASIVQAYLDEGKSRLQEEALERAKSNKRFIEEQIVKTVDPLTKERLYSLLAQEIEREMMARNREQFGFRVIDSPRIPDKKSGPKRLFYSVVVMMIALMGYVTFRMWWK